MTRIIITILLCLVGISSVAAEECSTYSLKISLSEKDYYSGDLVIMDIKITNISQNNITIPSIMELQDYWLKLNITYNGSDLKYIGPEKKLRNLKVLSTIRPGYYYGRAITLNEYFDIRKPGEYNLQATYGVGPDLIEIKQGKCIRDMHFNIKQKN